MRVGRSQGVLAASLCLLGLEVATAATPTQAVTVPLTAAPVISTVHADGTDVVIGWYGVKGATGYEIMRAPDPQQPATKVASLADTSLGYRDRQAGPGPLYYQVVAVGAGGSRMASAWFAFAPTTGGAGITATSRPVAPAGSPVPGGPAALGSQTVGSSAGGAATGTGGAAGASGTNPAQCSCCSPVPSSTPMLVRLSAVAGYNAMLVPSAARALILGVSILIESSAASSSAIVAAIDVTSQGMPMTHFLTLQPASVNGKTVWADTRAVRILTDPGSSIQFRVAGGTTAGGGATLTGEVLASQ